MQKSRVSNIPSLPLPKEMTGNEKYKIAVDTVDNLVQLSIYTDNKEKPEFDVFIDAGNEDWITKKYSSNEMTYSDAMIDKFMYAWYSESIVSNVALLQETFHTDSKTGNEFISDISWWQKKAREKQNMARLSKKFDKWDKELSVIPNDIFPAFKKMMAKEGSGEYFMFFENKDSKTGYCSHCRKEVPLMKPAKQNQEAKCPCCKKKVTYKRQNQIETLEVKYYDGAYAQKVGDLTIIRKFYGSQSYRGRDYMNPYIRLEESVRYILYPNGTVSRFWHGMYNQNICRWNKNDKDSGWARTYRYYAYDTIRNVYKGNLTGILKHSAWDCWKKKPCDVIRYLIIENQTEGVIEKLARVGLFNIATYLMEFGPDVFYEKVNMAGKDLGQIMLLDKARLKRLVQFDSLEHYKWLLREKKDNTVYDDQMIKRFVESKISDYTLSRLPKQMNYTQIDSYLTKQVEITSETYDQVATIWKDYLQIAEGNGWNMESPVFYKPKDLKNKHAEALLFRDGVSIEEETTKLEEDFPKVDENLSLMKRFEFSNDEFAILVPQNIKDIVKEGHSLQHCIHQVTFYFERITNQETYIFFLRKKDNVDMSWYTLEVEHSGNILQKRTTLDNQNKDIEIALPFLKEFQQHFLSIMTEQDKVLGAKADEIRKERYAELRKNQNKIWNGKLKNKLLADVLEADLIVA